MRAVILGLLGVATVCGFTYFNDRIMMQTYFVGNNMPISVYGGLIIFLMVVNPLLFRLAKRLALSRHELVIALAMTLAACAIPASGLMRTLPGTLIMPHWYERTEPGWQQHDVVDMTPEGMLVDVGDDDNQVLSGFVQGLATGKQHISPSQVPWKAWLPALRYWLPIVLLLWVGLIALSLVVHRQWADHEHLPYPLATFTDALLPGEGSGLSSVFRSRAFWIGTATVLVIHMVNYAHAWWQDFITIPTAFDFRALGNLVPTFTRGGGGQMLYLQFYFTPLAIAYFLSTDVSFSLGIGPYLFALANGIFIGYGVSLTTGGSLEPGNKAFLNFGAYLGFALIIVYSGRYYYLSVLRRAVGLRAQAEVDQTSVWGARVFMGSMALFVMAIVASGLDWQLALPFAAITVIIFLVLARLLAETGLFFMQPFALPCAILWGIFGARALGPRQLLIMFMFTSVLLIDPRESLMPFVVNALKLGDLGKVRAAKTGMLSVVAVVVGLAIAVPATLYFQYDRGVGKKDAWGNRSVPTMPYSSTLQARNRLVAQDKLEEAEAVKGWARFGAMAPRAGYLIAFATTLLLVLGCYAARLYLPRWPIHPVLFLFWAVNWNPVGQFAVSFLAGCAVKFLVVKYGGEGVYRRAKPIMFGLIAGDVLGGVLPMIIGFVYYLITGDMPKKFIILPT